MENLKIDNTNKLYRHTKRLKKIITSTILSCQKYKLFDILGTNEISICINTLDTLFNDINNEINKLDKPSHNISDIKSKIYKIQDEIILIIKNLLKHLVVFQINI